MSAVVEYRGCFKEDLMYEIRAFPPTAGLHRSPLHHALHPPRLNGLFTTGLSTGLPEPYRCLIDYSARVVASLRHLPLGA